MGKSIFGNMLVLATVLMMMISVVATICMAASSGNGDPNEDKVPILVKFKASANARDRILEAYKKNPSVERANGAIKLQVAGIPDDPKYAQQWALPKIAWDTAYDTISISNSATLAVLDTGVDASHPDLSARIITGNSSIGGDPKTDPNGHGTALKALRLQA
jgi:subtilisin family serine protease